ncbi:MAG: hypothetical protein CMJ48_00125 [Planctomycetaceae bacterium]|nr:hypothetical protein [Planctomycetaceae bacterium]
MRIVLISMLLLTVGCRTLSPGPSPQVAVQQAVEARAESEDQASVIEFGPPPEAETSSPTIRDMVCAVVWGPPVFVAMIISCAIGASI